ncbi:MAG: hypothetical protein M3Z66_06270, partial [Chloroflexota bacterium]|nr:hypothetical protein [Chloroflexota bacterium]
GGRLAGQLHLDAGAVPGYGEREHTRTDHLRRVAVFGMVPTPVAEEQGVGGVPAGAGDGARLAPLLFRLACDRSA